MLTEEGKSGLVRTRLHRVISFFVVTSIYIGAAAVMLLFFSFLLYAIPVDVRLLLATFLITFSVYNLNKMTDIGEDTINLPYRTRFIARHKRAITVAVCVAVSSALLLALSHSVYAMLVISSPLIIGFLYSIGVAGFRLKQIKGLKSVVVALSWAFVATMLPLAVAFRGIVETLLIFWFFFVKLFVNVTLFDLRDVEGDVIHGTMTVPVILGKSKTHNVLLVANSSLVLWFGYCYFFGIFDTYLPLLALFILYGYWYILTFCEGPIAEGSLDIAVDGEWFFVITAAILIMASSN